MEHLIVHIGQHYDPKLSEVFFQDLEILRPDVHLNVGSASHGVQTKRMLAELEPVIAEAQPYGVLVHGDASAGLRANRLAVKFLQPNNVRRSLVVTIHPLFTAQSGSHRRRIL